MDARDFGIVAGYLSDKAMDTDDEYNPGLTMLWTGTKQGKIVAFNIMNTADTFYPWIVYGDGMKKWEGILFKTFKELMDDLNDPDEEIS